MTRWAALEQANPIGSDEAEAWARGPAGTAVRQRASSDRIQVLSPPPWHRSQRLRVGVLALAVLIPLTALAAAVALRDDPQRAQLSAELVPTTDVALGSGFLWSPSGNPAPDAEAAATRFAQELLGWVAPVSPDPDAPPGGPTWVDISDGSGHRARVLAIPRGAGWVIQAAEPAGPTLRVVDEGVELRLSDVPPGAVSAAIFVHADGRTSSVTIRDPRAQEGGGVLLEATVVHVDAVLIRFLDADGGVIGVAASVY